MKEQRYTPGSEFIDSAEKERGSYDDGTQGAACVLVRVIRGLLVDPLIAMKRESVKACAYTDHWQADLKRHGNRRTFSRRDTEKSLDAPHGE